MKNLTIRPRRVNESNIVVFPGTLPLVRDAVNYVKPGSGVKPEEMRARFRVLDALDAAPEAAMLALEDADAATLQRCVLAVDWARVDRDILRFCDDVASME